MKSIKTIIIIFLTALITSAGVLCIQNFIIQKNNNGNIYQALPDLKDRIASDHENGSSDEKDKTECPALNSTDCQKKITLSEEYLTTAKWGPEGRSFGKYLYFDAGGMFYTKFSGEGGEVVNGNFQIKDNTVTLEGDDGSEEILTPGESSESFYYAQYLASNGIIKYWNLNTAVPENNVRYLTPYFLITTNEKLKPKKDATARSSPNKYSNKYIFRDCSEGCEEGEEYTLESVFGGMLARTQFKEKLNGTEAYWYLADINPEWYSGVLIGDQLTDTPLYVWIHGSELE